MLCWNTITITITTALHIPQVPKIISLASSILCLPMQLECFYESAFSRDLSSILSCEVHMGPKHGVPTIIH
jgi:hypothetical protein